jgi:hypothetical protein
MEKVFGFLEMAENHIHIRRFTERRVGSMAREKKREIREEGKGRILSTICVVVLIFYFCGWGYKKVLV